MITRLLRKLLGDAPDPAWKPTSLKFTTGRDYREDLAVQGARRARTRTATGRKIARPKPVQADVLPFQKRAVK